MKLLIIDDSPRIRKSLLKSIALVPKITSVFEASDVDDGLDKIKIHNPDIIILDIMLKSGTGLDILKGISDLIESKLIIAYSSFITPRYIELLESFGVENYFDKNTEIIDIIKFIQLKIEK